MNEIILKLDNIVKSFGDVKVLNNINLEVEKGEFITLLGSSGCGKTTTLRIIGGLEDPDQGKVILEGQDVTNTAPNKRSVNTVFQNYALFPHMSVEKNIGYGLKLRGTSKLDIANAVKRSLELVQLEGFEKRRVNELSGGQRQRVAIARAVVNEPKILLLDEPLSSLDSRLRHQMQDELKSIQKRLGITFIYITHDQEEALTMSDRIAVMRDGRFEQIGTPDEIYNSPKTSYIADFVGGANILDSTVTRIDGDIAILEGKCGNSLVKLNRYSMEKTSATQAVRVSVRSENILINENNCGISGKVVSKTFAGGMLRIGILLDCGRRIVASRHGINSELNPDDKVMVGWHPENAILVDLEEDAHVE